MVDAVIHSSQGPQGRSGRVISWVLPLTEGHNQRDWGGSQVLSHGLGACFLSICDTSPDMHIAPSFRSSYKCHLLREAFPHSITYKSAPPSPPILPALFSLFRFILYSHSTYHLMTYYLDIYFVYACLSSIRKLAPRGLYSQYLDEPGT